MHRKTHLSLILALLIVLVGCNAVNSEDEKSEFELAVSGEFDTSLSGMALFSEALHDQDAVFLIQLQSDTENPYVLISIESLNPQRLGMGSYRIVGGKASVENPATDVIVVYTRSQQDPFLFDPFTATGGTLEVTHSSESSIRGHIQFDATGQNALQIGVTGSLNAIPGR